MVPHCAKMGLAIDVEVWMLGQREKELPADVGPAEVPADPETPETDQEAELTAEQVLRFISTDAQFEGMMRWVCGKELKDFHLFLETAAREKAIELKHDAEQEQIEEFKNKWEKE